MTQSDRNDYLAGFTSVRMSVLALQSVPDTKREWIARVLGVSVTGSHSADLSGSPTSTIGAWNEAKDAVDTGLNRLFGVLRKIGLPALGQAAEAIENVLEGYRTGLTTALMRYDSASADKKEDARAAALKIVEEYAGRLPGDKHVIAADNNPFDIPVNAQTTLATALGRLRNLLAAS